MSKIFISTTGTLNPVNLEDLGGRSFSHPTTDYEITSEYTIEELRYSHSLTSAVTGGTMTMKNDEGYNLTGASNIMYVRGMSGGTNVKDAINASFNDMFKEVAEYRSSYDDGYVYSGGLLGTVPFIFRENESTMMSATTVTNLDTSWTGRTGLTYA